MRSSCEGRTGCTAASDWHLFLYGGHFFFFPLAVALMQIYPRRQQQQSLAAFGMHPWITADLRTGSLTAEGEKMLI